MKAIILDTETTGFTDPEVIEAAWVESGANGDIYCERFLPSKKIDLGAMATHGIIMADLKDCRPSAAYKLPEVEYLIGHNIDFDWEVSGKPAARRICTLALSRWLFPSVDSHKLGAMVFHFLPHDVAREMCQSAHNALADARMCRLILFELIAEMKARGMKAGTWPELWQASELARIPVYITFGKHKGTAIAALPRDYKTWLLKQDDVDPYLRQALEGK